MKSIEEFLPPHIRALHPYVPGKPVEEVERELKITALKLASNENPLGPSPLAKEAIREAASWAHRYPDDTGYYLRLKLAARLDVHPDQIILGSGSTDLIEIVAKAFLQEGAEAVTSEGSFIMYYVVAQMIGATLHRAPLRDYTYDPEALAAAVTPRTRVVFIANPNNPTGTCLRALQVDALLNMLPEDTLVVLDEAYYEYVNDPAYSRALAYVREGRPVLVLRTFSKIYGLAGLRIGYGIGSRELVNGLNRVRSPFNTSALAQAAAMAAMDDHAHVAASIENNARELPFLRQQLAEMGIFSVPSVTNFLLVDAGRDAQEVFELLLRQGVIVRPMKQNGFPTALRVTVGRRGENERFLKAMKTIVETPAALSLQPTA